MRSRCELRCAGRCCLSSPCYKRVPVCLLLPTRHMLNTPVCLPSRLTTCLQESAEAAGSTHAMLTAADSADPQRRHRLLWLAEQQPLVDQRLAGVAGQVRPTQAAIGALDGVRQQIESTFAAALVQPPVVEVEAARDAAILALAADLTAEGLAELPATMSRSAMRGAITEAIENARRLPEQPGFVDYSPLLADIARWVGELQGCGADVAAAAEEASQATADNAGRLAAADAAADAETHYRLTWLAEQLPLVEQRLGAVDAKVAPTRAAAHDLQALARRIESDFVPALVQPPLAEAEGLRDGVIGGMVETLGKAGLRAQVRAGRGTGRMRGLLGCVHASAAKLRHAQPAERILPPLSPTSSSRAARGWLRRRRRRRPRADCPGDDSRAG